MSTDTASGQRELERLAIDLTVCPTCQAGPGFGCVTPGTSQWTGVTHAARLYPVTLACALGRREAYRAMAQAATTLMEDYT
jgi:hypothetical protein